MDELSRVYIKIDDSNRIVRCEGEYTLTNIRDIENWILIEEGEPCDRLNHAQVMYFEDGLYTDDDIPRYVYENGECRLRTEEEIQADRDAFPSAPPSAEEDLMDMAIDHEYRITLLELGLSDY